MRVSGLPSTPEERLPNGVHARAARALAELAVADPGTIVYFTVQEPRRRLVATLVPGSVDEHGVLRDCRWTDSTGGDWSVAVLEAGGPVLKAPRVGFDVTHPVPGMIITFDDPDHAGNRLVATFAPAGVELGSGLFGLGWVDSFGTHFSYDEILRGGPRVHGREIAQPVTVAELRALLETHIPDHVYSLDEPWKGEACYLVHRGDQWFTFYLERGRENRGHEFSTESAACSYFWDWMQEGDSRKPDAP